MQYKVTNTIQHDCKLLTVKMDDKQVLTGGTNKTLVRYTLPTLQRCNLATHDKSIRATAINDNFFGCASYDGTCTIYKDNELFDIVEGPETEIKDLCFAEDNKYIAIATRGKTVWVLAVNEDSLEIDAVLDYHTQDVKGCVFYNNLYTYGYDNTIKVFEKTDFGKQDWEMIQNIEEHENTVWQVVFFDTKMVSCDANGYINIYKFDNEWKIDTKHKASMFDIYSICVIDDKYLAYTMNLRSVMIVDVDFVPQACISNMHSSDINQIAYNKNMLATVGDDGKLNLTEFC